MQNQELIIYKEIHCFFNLQYEIETPKSQLVILTGSQFLYPFMEMILLNLPIRLLKVFCNCCFSADPSHTPNVFLL